MPFLARKQEVHQKLAINLLQVFFSSALQLTFQVLTLDLQIFPEKNTALLTQLRDISPTVLINLTTLTILNHSNNPKKIYQEHTFIQNLNCFNCLITNKLLQS